MAKRMTIVIVALAVVFGGVLGWHALKGYFIAQAIAKMTSPPQTVSAMKAPLLPWEPTLQSVGSLRAVQGVDVTTELGGLVEEINFKSGDRVKAGDLLVQLDVSADKAALKGMEAAAKLAQINFERDQKLVEKRAVSTSQLQQDQSKLANALAAVAQQKAVIAKKTIRAPFDGELGVRQVDLGQYVGPGTKVVTLQSLKSVYVEFSLPQKDIDKVSQGQGVSITVDAYPDQVFKGKVNAIEPKVNRATRNFNLQATIPNPDRRLRPGMFANVAVDLPGEPKFVTLPGTAIAYNPYGDYVYIVEQKGKDEQGHPIFKVHQRFVQVGESRGDQVAIVKGVKPGQRVVTAGQLKLKEDTRVIINNKVQPPFNSAPDLPNG